MANERHELYNPNKDPLLKEFRWFHENVDLSPEERQIAASQSQLLLKNGLKILNSKMDLKKKYSAKECKQCFTDAAALGNTAALAQLAKVQAAFGAWWNKAGSDVVFQEPVEHNPLKAALYYRHAIEANYNEISTNLSNKTKIEQANNTLIYELTNLALQFSSTGDNIYMPFHAALAISHTALAIGANRDGSCFAIISHFNSLAMNQPKIFDKLCSGEDRFKINQALYPHVRDAVDQRNLLPAAIKHALSTEILNELDSHEKRRELPNKASALITSFLNPESQYSEALLKKTAESIRLNNLPLNYPEKIALLDDFKKSDLRTIREKEIAIIKDFLKDDSIYNIIDLCPYLKHPDPTIDVLTELKNLQNKDVLTVKERLLLGLSCCFFPELGAPADYLQADNSLSDRFALLIEQIVLKGIFDPSLILIIDAEISFFKEATEKYPLDAFPFEALAALYCMKKNPVMEQEYLQKALQIGHARLAFRMATDPTYKSEQISLLTIAAQKGYMNSLSLLAKCYQIGDGVPKDETFAQACFNLAKEAPTFTPSSSNPGVIYQQGLGFLASGAYSKDPTAPQLDIGSDANKAKNKFNRLPKERPDIFCGLLALYKDSLSAMIPLLTPENYTNINQRQEEYLSNLSKRETALKELMAELKIDAQDTEEIITQYASNRNRPLINLSLFNTNSAAAPEDLKDTPDSTSSPAAQT